MTDTATPKSGVARISYWSIVWAQLQRSRLAIFGVRSVLALVALAVYAPLISLNRPFWFSPPQGFDRHPAALAWPWFAALFDRNFFENGVDFFFNTVMVLSPFIILLWFLLSRCLDRHLWETIRGSFILGSIIAIGLVFVFLWSYPNRHGFYDYRGSIQRWEEAGYHPSYMFPLMRHSYRGVDVTRAHPRPPSREHVFGTDREGRDVFVRMLYGTRISLTIGVVAVAIYVFIGIVLGSLAGYYGGPVDIIISRFIEIMLCFPAFFLILTLAAFIEQRSIFHVMAIIGFTSWTGVARLVRGEFLRQRSLDYVQAAIALGFSKKRIIFGHVLPNAIAPVLVSATFGIAGAILTESSLSFLGLGDLTAPSWGGILSAGRSEGKLWLILIPGFAIFFVVSVFNLVGEGLRDALDPKLRQ